MLGALSSPWPPPLATPAGAWAYSVTSAPRATCSHAPSGFDRVLSARFQHTLSVLQAWLRARAFSVLSARSKRTPSALQACSTRAPSVLRAPCEHAPKCFERVLSACFQCAFRALRARSRVLSACFQRAASTFRACSMSASLQDLSSERRLSTSSPHAGAARWAALTAALSSS